MTCDVAHKIERLIGPYIEVFHEGARSRDPDTYKKDAEILQEEHYRHPEDPRTAFYLAQSYRDCGNTERALITYLIRAEMPGWDQETWYARYQAAILTETLGRAPELISRAYLEAYNARPSRAEPLVRLARWHRGRGEFALAYLYAAQAAVMPVPADILFVESQMYEWQALDELSVSAYYTDNKAVGKTAAEEVLKRGIPPREVARFQKNLAFYNGAAHG